MRTLDPSDFPVKERYGMLVGTIAPRPIALASTPESSVEDFIAQFRDQYT